MGSALGAEPNISNVYIGNIWRMRADWTIPSPLYLLSDFHRSRGTSREDLVISVSNE